MNERMRALEKLANSPNTPPNEAANARRILERLKKEAAANGNASTGGNAKPPPEDRQTVYFYVPGGGVFMIGADQVAEMKQIHPNGRVLTKEQADAWFAQGSSSPGRRSKRTSKKSAPRKKRAATTRTKTTTGKRKPPPKTQAEKTIKKKDGFIANVLRRGNSIRVAVATDDKVVGTWEAKGAAQIRAVLKKALAQAHLLAQRGYETCIAVVYPDGSKTVQCWPE